MRNFDEISVDELRASGSRKWSLYPDCIGMWVAEMDLGVAPEIASVLTGYAEGTCIGYRSPEQTAELQEVTATWYSQSFGYAVTPEQVQIAPDVVAIFTAVVREFTNPGDKIVMPTPGYMAFLAAIPQLGRTAVEVPSPIEDGRYVLDLEAIRAALEDGAKLVILVNPGNPVGRVYSRAELEALDAVLADFPDVRLFSDEIHAPLVLDGSHVPYASVSPNAERQSITAISASKGWNIPGLKAAQTIVTNSDDVDRLAESFSFLDSVTPTIGVAAATAALRDAQGWMDHTREYVRANRDYLEGRIATIDGVSMVHPEGTYIALLDFGAACASGRIQQGTTPAQFLRENAKVALTDGPALGSGCDDFARLIYATPRHILEEAVDRIERALG